MHTPERLIALTLRQAHATIGVRNALTWGNGGREPVEDRIKTLEAKFEALEQRVTALEAFTGVNDFDATGREPLHRRLDWLEDWRRDCYVD